VRTFRAQALPFIATKLRNRSWFSAYSRHTCGDRRYKSDRCRKSHLKFVYFTICKIQGADRSVAFEVLFEGHSRSHLWRGRTAQTARTWRRVKWVEYRPIANYESLSYRWAASTADEIAMSQTSHLICHHFPVLHFRLSHTHWLTVFPEILISYQLLPISPCAIQLSIKRMAWLTTAVMRPADRTRHSTRCLISLQAISTLPERDGPSFPDPRIVYSIIIASIQRTDSSKFLDAY